MCCLPEEQIQNVWKVYLMLLKSIRLEINDIEIMVYVCMGRICSCSEDMAFFFFLTSLLEYNCFTMVC